MDLNHVRQLMRSLYWSTEREINHIATVEPSAPGENYSLLIMGAAMAVKMAVEMASGGNSPSRRRAGTETSVPRILISRWRRLWKVFSGFVNRGRGFRSGTTK